jgi:acetylornithine deacetylase/succinyl-diaminopimelate desuccinylase-like protein
VITIDRRLIPGETLKEAFDEISVTIDKEKKANPSLVASIEEKIGISPCSISPEESIVNTVKDSIYQVIKKNREVTGFGACCDMWCLVEKANIPTVILGPGKLSMAHKVNESISLNELYDAVKIYTTIALNWLK